MSSRTYQYVALATALFFTLLAYLPGLHGPFVFDDVTSILQNRALVIHGLTWDQLAQAMLSSDTGPLRRPLSMLTFAFNIYFNGMDPTAFKVTNLVIHLLNGVLVFALLRKIVRYWMDQGILGSSIAAFWLPLLCTSAWLLHPLNLTSVLYVVQRETSLSSLFILAGCVCYVHARLCMQADKTEWWWLYIGTIVSGLLAILSKETGLLLPVYMLVIELCVFHFRSGNNRMQRGLFVFFGLFLLLPLCLGLVWLFGIHHGGQLSYVGRDFTLSERLLTESRVVWDYIRWTLFPRLPDLGLYHDDIPLSTGVLTPPTTLLSIMGLGVLLAAAGFSWEKRPWIAFGILWFFTGQLLESTVWPLEIAFEHRNYLADLGILIAVFGFILTEPSRFLCMRYRVGVLLALVLTYGAVTTMRAYVWRSSLSLVKTQAANHPRSPYATYALGQELTNLVLADERQLIPEAEAALAHSASLPNSGIIPGAALALLESQTTGDNDPANFARMAQRLRTHAISSSDQQGITSLVQCEEADNCHFPPGALQSLFDAALANPRIRENPGVYANILTEYGNLLSQGTNGDLHKSRDLMQQAADLVPNEPQYRINVVTLDIALRDPVLAKHDLQKVAALNRLGNLNQVIADFKTQIDEIEAGPVLQLHKKQLSHEIPASATNH